MQIAAKDADQDFEQNLALPSEIGDDAQVDLEIERDGQHMNQARADRRVLVIARFAGRHIDLGQYLQARIARSQNSDHAAGAQGMSAMFEHPAAAAASKDRTRRQARQPVGMVSRDPPRPSP